MAYVDGFEHDIFISYAHVDNLTATPKPPWVDEFHKHLDIALARRIGRMGIVQIWRDEQELSGTQLFDLTIAEAIDASAVFLVLTSKGYLQSYYNEQELSYFFETASRHPIGLEVGDRFRIINVLLSNVPHDEWPEEFGQMKGFMFHDAVGDDQLGMPSEPGSDLFKKQLRTLADALVGLLEAVQGAVHEASAVTPTLSSVVEPRSQVKPKKKTQAPKKKVEGVKPSTKRRAPTKKKVIEPDVAGVKPVLLYATDPTSIYIQEHDEKIWALPVDAIVLHIDEQPEFIPAALNFAMQGLFGDDGRGWGFVDGVEHLKDETFDLTHPIFAGAFKIDGIGDENSCL